MLQFPERRDGYWLWIGGPVPPGAAAITLASLVIVRRAATQRASFDRLLRHELVHVRQYREQGWLRFVLRYVASYGSWRLRGYGHHGAYQRIPAEIEAVWETSQW